MSDSLLPPNASALERVLEAATARLGQTPVPIRNLWHPDLCPEPLLPWLAWSFSVDHWDANWDEQTKRNAIKASFDVHRFKGTVKAVKEALSVVGVDIELAEWFDLDGEPHTFRLDININENLLAGNPEVSPELLANVFAIVDRTKPVRAHYALALSSYFSSTLRTGAVLRVAKRLEGKTLPPVARGRLRNTVYMTSVCRVAKRVFLHS